MQQHITASATLAVTRVSYTLGATSDCTRSVACTRMPFGFGDGNLADGIRLLAVAALRPERVGPVAWRTAAVAPPGPHGPCVP